MPGRANQVVKRLLVGMCVLAVGKPERANPSPMWFYFCQRNRRDKQGMLKRNVLLFKCRSLPVSGNSVMSRRLARGSSA